MEYYFPTPKPNLLTGSILFILATIVFVVMFYFLGNSYALVMIPIILLTLVTSIFCLSKHLAEKYRQFLITYSLNVFGFSREIGYHDIADYLIDEEDVEDGSLRTTYPVKNAIMYHYHFPDPQKDYVVVYDQNAVPELGDYRVFVRNS